MSDSNDSGGRDDDVQNVLNNPDDCYDYVCPCGGHGTVGLKGMTCFATHTLPECADYRLKDVVEFAKWIQASKRMAVTQSPAEALKN